MKEAELRTIIQNVLQEMGETPITTPAAPGYTAEGHPISNDGIRDITAIDLRKDFHVPNAHNKDAYLKLKEVTPARLGVSRAGPRFLTETLLRFRADHAAAKDAVLNQVDDATLESMNLFSVQSQVADKDQYITRPDLGRLLSDEAVATIKEKCKPNPTVQIYLTDGLSSTAIETNGADVLAATMQGLNSYGIDVGTPFFLKYGRVNSCDEIAQVTGAEVVAVLVGERPGLVTSESMSCYMTYKAYPGMPEAKRTVISNIHRQGTNAAEAGAHIADVIKKIIDNKASGLDLNL